MGLQALHWAVPEGTEAGTAPVAADIGVGGTAEVGIGVAHPRALPTTYSGDTLLESFLFTPAAVQAEQALSMIKSWRCSCWCLHVDPSCAIRRNKFYSYKTLASCR